MTEPLEEFQRQINEMKISLDMLSNAESLRKYAGKIIGLVYSDQHAAGLLTKLKSEADYDFPIVVNSMIPSSWGCFEQYLRSVLPLCARLINEHGLSCAEMPPQWLHGNLKITAMALQDSIGDSALFRYELDRMTREFAENYQKDGKFVLNDQAVGVIFGKFSVPDIEKYCARIGFKWDWKSVGDCEDLQVFFGVSNKTKAGNSCEEFLGDLVKDRNKIAHRGEGGTLNPFAPVERILEFLAAFTTRLDVLLCEHVEKCKTVRAT